MSINLEERFDSVEEMKEFFNSIFSAGIYERLDNLDAEVASIKSQLTALEPTALAADTDLNTLGVGNYIIPTSAVSGTLLNKPTTSTATGFIKVIPGGSSSQLIMYYIPCANSPSYYQRAYYTGVWQAWHEVNLYDGGWIDLPLQNGATPYNAAQTPQYRKVGNQIFIRGVFKGITERCTVAILPAAYRPSQRIMLNLPRTGYVATRFEIETTGEVNYIGSSDIINENTWFSFSNTSFFAN